VAGLKQVWEFGIEKPSLSFLLAVLDGAYTFISCIPLYIVAIARPDGTVVMFVSCNPRLARMDVPRGAPMFRCVSYPLMFKT
jgi:hypothetical protein